MGSILSKPLEYPGGTYVLVVSWRKDGYDRQSAILMGRAWEERQAQVTYLDDRNYKDPVDGEPGSESVEEAIYAWQARSDVQEAGAPKQLLVLCFFGHGNVHDPEDDASTDEEVLWGCREDHKHGFNMTQMAQQMRDFCYSDVLYILECCNAASLGAPELWQVNPWRCRNWWMKMEVLAAGPGGIDTGDTLVDFSCRVRNELRKRGRQTVVDMFQRVLVWECAYAPGYWRQFSGNGSIVLDDLWRGERKEQEIEPEEELDGEESEESGEDEGEQSESEAEDEDEDDMEVDEEDEEEDGDEMEVDE